MPAEQTEGHLRTGAAVAAQALSPGLVEWAIYLLIAVIVGTAILAPLALPYLIPILGLTVMINDWLTGRLGVPKGLAGPVPVAAYAISLLVLLSALWSMWPAESYGSAAIQVLLAFSAVGIPSWFALLPHADKIKVLRPVAIGGLIGLALLLADILVSGALTAAVVNTEPGLVNMAQKGLRYDDAGATSVLGFYFNRNVAALVLVLPAVLLALHLCPPFAGRGMMIFGTGIAAVAAVLLSSSESSKVALLAAGAAYTTARVWPRLVRNGLLAVVAIAVLLAVPMARLPFAAGMHNDERLPLSFRDRVVIWDYTAAAVARAPWLGLGVRGNAVLHSRYKTTLGGDEASQVLQRRPGWHPHNAYLEVWSELGIVGAILTLLLGLAAIIGIDRMPPLVRPAGYALVAATMAILATGWSIWQPWLIGAIVAGIIMLQLGSRTVIDQRSI